MSRLLTSLIIIISLLVLDLCSHSVILRENRKLAEPVCAVQKYVSEERTEEAVSEAEKLNREWEKSRKKLALFVSDKELDEISDSIARLKLLVYTESDEVLAETEHIKKELIRPHQRDIPCIHNIF